MSQENRTQTTADLRRRGVLPTPAGQAPPFQQKYLPEKIDVEQVVLQTVMSIQMTFFSVVDTFDAGKSKAMFIAGVLNLDSVVMGILKSIENENVKRFLGERDQIVKEWHDGAVADDAGKTYDSARRLYTLIIDALNREGVFKFRRMAYFGVGWKKRQEAEIEANLQQIQEDEQEDDNFVG